MTSSTQRKFKLGAALFMAGYFVACAPVNFDGQKDSTCAAAGSSCVVTAQGDTYSFDQTVPADKVDILIVDDNSGSMSPEQQNMAMRFQSFINSISTYDYRVAITTTDIAGVAPPPNASPSTTPSDIANGNLKLFGSKHYLDSSNAPSDFTNAIQRQETKDCEDGGYHNCPSGDERGLFAANLALDHSSQFIRSTGHLAIIILSDEDERGLSDHRSVYSNDPNSLNTYNYQQSSMPLEPRDRAATLIAKFKSLYPAKTLSAHAIIVRPGDSSCLNAQSDPTKNIRGTEGYSYADFVRQVAPDLDSNPNALGSIGDICANDYTAQLQNIGSVISNAPFAVDSKCANPTSYSVTVNGQPATGVHLDSANMHILFDRPAVGSSIHVEIACPAQ